MSAALTSVGNELKELWSGGQGRFLVVIAGGWGVLLGTRMAYPVRLPYLRSSFGLSLTAAGLLVTVLWLGSALGQLPGGMLADRYSERTVMVAGTGVVAAAPVLVLVAPTAAVLFAATALVGLGQSLYPIARITIRSEVYPDRIGSALGVAMATSDLGQTVVPPVAGVLAAAVAWQAGLGVVVPFLLLAGGLLWVVLPAGTSTGSGGATFSVGHVGAVCAELRRSNMTFVGFILFLYVLVWQSFTGFYPTYLVDGFWALAAVTVVVSTMLGSGAITQSFLSDSIPAAVRGTGLGVVRTTAVTLGAAGPVLFGATADRGYFDEGYVVLGATTAAVVLLTLRLPKSPPSPAS